MKPSLLPDKTMYNTAMLSVLLCRCKTWSFLVENAWQIPMFNHIIYGVLFESGAGIGWGMTTRHRVLGVGNRPLIEIIILHQSLWFGHIAYACLSSSYRALWTYWATLERAWWPDYELTSKCSEASIDSDIGCCFPSFWLGPRDENWRWLTVWDIWVRTETNDSSSVGSLRTSMSHSPQHKNEQSVSKCVLWKQKERLCVHLVVSFPFCTMLVFVFCRCCIIVFRRRS